MLALCLWAATAPASAQRRVVIRAPSRAFSLACTAALGGASFSFSADEWYASARASLLDPANFGATGTVPIELVFGPPYDSFSPEVLDGADILVLNPYSATPQGSDLRVFGVYARSGVGFISFQNAAATYFASAGPCASDNNATFPTAAGDPVLTGPFGTVRSPYFTGYNCSFTTPDPLAVVLSSNVVGPNALRLDLSARYPGGARTVSFGDEEHFGGLSVPGCGAGGLTRGGNNDVLMRNVFAWVGATAHDPIPSSLEGTGDQDGDGITDDLDGDDDGDGILDLFEAGDADPATPPIDTDHDGTPDYRDTDSDGDGVLDAIECGAASLDEPIDTDGDHTPDFLDGDSDGDTVPDSVEGNADTDHDGTPDYRDTDSDGDTVLDGVDDCRTVANVGQIDSNHDGVGDACEPDAGLHDGSTSTDAGAIDAGDTGLADAARIDAALLADGGRMDGGRNDGGNAGGDAGAHGSSASGCGCHAGGPRTTSWAALVIALAVALCRARLHARRREYDAVVVLRP